MEDEAIKRFALDIVCQETCLQLALCQRSQRLRISNRGHGPSRSRHHSPAKVTATQGNAEGGKLSCEKNSVLTDIKLCEDIQAIEDIFHMVLKQLRKDEQNPEIDVANLNAAIAAFEDKSSDTLKDLKAEVKTLRQTIQKLKDQHQSDKNDNDRVLNQSSEDIVHVRHQILTGLWTHNLEMKMLKRWKSNRLEMLQVVHEKQHRALMDTLLATKRKIGQEERLIKDVLSFRYDETFLLKRDMDLARKRFELERTKAMAGIDEVRERIAQQQQLLEEKRRIHQEHQDFIDEFLRFKEDQKRQAEWQQHRRACAIRLQSWWRGVMVRRGLGRYRKKSKKSKTKAKKNK